MTRDCISSLMADRVLAKIESLDPARLRPFMQHYVEDVVVRPLLVSGMYATSKNPSPNTPERIYLLLVDKDQSPVERLKTVLHEAIHVQLLIAGIDEHFHDEVKVEACAERLANRLPETWAVLCDMYPRLAA